MNKTVQHPFQSDFGFKSPNFTIDNNGNIVANSISFRKLTPDTIDYALTDNDNGAIQITGLTGIYPSISLDKERSYNISLSLDSARFYIYEQDQTTLYNKSIVHSDGSSGDSSHGKNLGTITITIPESYDKTILYYTDQTKSQFGSINIKDPVGKFRNITITDTDEATSADTGVLQIAGGAGIKGNIFVEKDLHFSATQEQKITAGNDLTINSNTKLQFKINNTNIGTITSSGSTVPIINTSAENLTINGSSIDNTMIGSTTASTAKFSSADVVTTGSNLTSVPNKSYVDNTALSLAITFGI